MYAVNVADMTNFSPNIAFQIMVGAVVPSSAFFEAEPGKIDGQALLLECDEERGQAICSMLRKKWKAHELRLYYRPGPTGRWKRLP